MKISDHSPLLTGQRDDGLPLTSYTRRRPPFPQRAVRWIVFLTICLSLYGAARLARVDLNKLGQNGGRIAQWVGLMFPPYVDNFRQPPNPVELQNYLLNALTTVAIATVGTAAAAVFALIPAVLGARSLTPSLALFFPTRWLLNALRGVDSFIFAIFFVAAVGLGPFAGVLGVALHTLGSIGKLYAEALENLQLSPMAALEAAGVSRPKAIVYALVPDVMPTIITVTLYVWELNVRLSVALGVVGAGGIGQDVKNAIDLLNFPHLGVLLVIIVLMVAVIDALSSWLRRAIQ
jgi:phosphonate transport system permease protein